MKASIALSVYALALAGPASIFAKVVTVWDDTTVVVTVTRTGSPPAASPPPASSPPASSPPASSPPASSSTLPQLAKVEEKNAINPAIPRSSRAFAPPPQAPISSSPPPPPPPPPPPSSSSSVYSAPSQANPSAPAVSATMGGGGGAGTPGGLTSSSTQICINFSGNDNFHWLNSGGWGTASGAGTKSASQCFDFAPSAAMFLCENDCQGSGDSPDYKYTKLECTFGGGYQNCDVSLVDGYSLPLECTIPGARPVEKIGGTADLASLGSCTSKGLDNTCKNMNSYGSSASGVSSFFQPAYSDDGNAPGGNYCIFQYCGSKSDVYFDGTPTIECKVGGSGSAASKRELTATAEELLKREEGNRAHGHRHMHQHAHKRARGLKDVLV